jgi:hypothetical protein
MKKRRKQWHCVISCHRSEVLALLVQKSVPESDPIPLLTPVVSCCLCNGGSKFTRVLDLAKMFIGQSLLRSQVQLFTTSRSQLLALLISVKCFLSFVGRELASALVRATLKTNWSRRSQTLITCTQTEQNAPCSRVRFRPLFHNERGNTLAGGFFAMDFLPSGFLLVGTLKIVGVFHSSEWCWNSAKSNCGRFSDNTQHVDFEGFWRWCLMYRTMRFILNFIHRLVYMTKITTFQRLDLSPSSGGWGKVDLLSWAR